MEEAAAELDTKFQETEKKLDNVSWKVEQLVKVDTSGQGGESRVKMCVRLIIVISIHSVADSDIRLWQHTSPLLSFQKE